MFHRTLLAVASAFGAFVLSLAPPSVQAACWSCSLYCEQTAWGGYYFQCEGYIPGHARTNTGWQSSSNVFHKAIAPSAFFLRAVQCRASSLPTMAFTIQYWAYFPPPQTTQSISNSLPCWMI